MHKKTNPLDLNLTVLDSAPFLVHGLFLEGVYKIELDTKTEYEGF